MSSVHKSETSEQEADSFTQVNALTSGDFLSTISMLDDVAEQYALRVLIQKNAALAKKTIRNYIIVSIGAQYAVPIANMIKSGIPQKKQDATDIRAQIRVMASYLKDADQITKLIFYMDDLEAVKRGLVPLSLTQKAQFVEKALQYLGASIPSLDAVGSALERLVGLGFVTQRDVQNKHTDKLYYANSQLLILWEKQKAVVDQKAKKTDSEKFWFG